MGKRELFLSHWVREEPIDILTKKCVRWEFAKLKGKWHDKKWHSSYCGVGCYRTVLYHKKVLPSDQMLAYASYSADNSLDPLAKGLFGHVTTEKTQGRGIFVSM